MRAGEGGGGVAVRSESLAGMSWRLFSGGVKGAQFNFGGGRAAGRLGELGATGWLRNFSRGAGGQRANFSPPSSLSEGMSCLGGGEGRGKERAAWAETSQRRVLCACVFPHGFSTRGACGFGRPVAFLNPAAEEEGGSRLRRAGAPAGGKVGGRFLAWAAPALAGARLPTPAESLPKVSLGFKELSEERGGGGEGGGG